MNNSLLNSGTTSAPMVIDVWNGMADPANAVINEYSCLSIPAFWSGVRFLSETLASLPKSTFQRSGNTRQPIDHPLNRLLARKANKYSTPFVVFETWHSHAIVHGNAYLYIERDPKTAEPIAFYNINPGIVTPFRYGGQQWYFIRGGASKDGKNTDAILNSADILHLPGLGFDGMVGYPVVWLMYEALELAKNSQRFASRYLKRGTQIQGSIEIPAGADEKKISAITDRIRRQHNGLETDYSFLVLTEGAKQTNSTIPPEQSQLLQSRQFAVVDICRILRVPPHVVYDLGRATWSNLEQMGIEVVKFSLRSWVEKAEQELSCKLLTEAEQNDGLYIRYSVDSLLRGDTTTQTNTTLSLVNGGVITANEGRAALDLSPLEDPSADKLRIPVNFPVAAPSPAASPAEDDKKSPPPANDSSGEEQDFASFSPLIVDVVTRVETKTNHAFENKKEKPQTEKTIWSNVFAEEQKRYLSEALAPVAAVIKTMTGRTINIAGIAESYASSIRIRAMGHEFNTLPSIVEQSIHPKGETDGK